MSVFSLQYVLLLVLSCMLTTCVPSGVNYLCARFCEKKYEEAIVENEGKNNLPLFRMIVMCAEQCGVQLNEKLIQMGRANLTEPVIHRIPSQIKWPEEYPPKRDPTRG